MPLNKAFPTTAGTTHPVQLRRLLSFEAIHLSQSKLLSSFTIYLLVKWLSPTLSHVNFHQWCSVWLFFYVQRVFLLSHRTQCWAPGSSFPVWFTPILTPSPDPDCHQINSCLQNYVFTSRRQRGKKTGNGPTLKCSEYKLTSRLTSNQPKFCLKHAVLLLRASVMPFSVCSDLRT